jgi:hypothetical protein
MLKPVPLLKYNLIKNNYCLCYYGINKEYLVQLKLLRPIIENAYKGIVLYICCSDDCLYLLSKEKNILTKSEFLKNKSNISYIRFLEDSIDRHPVEEIMKESSIPCGPVCVEKRENFSKKCALLTKGLSPVRSLNGRQINSALELISGGGFKVFINPSLNEIVDDFEMVVGVENEVLYECAARGLNVKLVPTGIGENLFLSMFPNNEIFSALK